MLLFATYVSILKVRYVVMYYDLKCRSLRLPQQKVILEAFMLADLQYSLSRKVMLSMFCVRLVAQSTNRIFKIAAESILR